MFAGPQYCWFVVPTHTLGGPLLMPHGGSGVTVYVAQSDPTQSLSSVARAIYVPGCVGWKQQFPPLVCTMHVCNIPPGWPSGPPGGHTNQSTV